MTQKKHTKVIFVSDIRLALIEVNQANKTQGSGFPQGLKFGPSARSWAISQKRARIWPEFWSEARFFLVYDKIQITRISQIARSGPFFDIFIGFGAILWVKYF